MKPSRTTHILATLVVLLAACSQPTPQATPSGKVQALATAMVGCSAADLITAISNANTNPGPDTLELAPGCTYTLTTANNTNTYEANGLSVTSEIVINGNGATIERSASADPFTVIGVSGGNLTLNNLSVKGGLNPIASGGGIYSFGTLTLNNTTVTGNTGHTGGIILFSGYGTLNNSTVSGNTGDAVGGIATNPATLTLNNSTVSGNTGGGIFINVGTLVLSNSIIANNGPGDCALSSGTVSDGGHNLIESTGPNACGLTNGVNGNIVGVEPMLGDLADNGGLTFTHALLLGSPALDKIPSGTGGCATDITTDQRGVARPQNGACDIGAFELDPPQAINQLIQKVQELGLEKNTAKSMIALLQNAQANLSKGAKAGALDKLTSFIAQINAQRGKKIGESAADALIAAANLIIQSISAAP